VYVCVCVCVCVRTGILVHDNGKGVFTDNEIFKNRLAGPSQTLVRNIARRAGESGWESPR
jgi:hypothetical protein